ncbi:nicotinamide riboside transporter PnuC, partial [Herbiconiux daphne]
VTTIGGVLFVLAVAFKKNVAPLLGAILSVLYGVLSYDSGFYANAALNMIILAPLQIWGWRHWMKHGDKAFEISDTWKRNIWIATGVGIVAATMFSIHSGSHLPYLDGPSSVLAVTGTVLLSLKTKEQWFAWIPYNLIECIMWFFAMSIEPSVIAIFVMRLVFLINSLIGAKEWFKNEK